MKRLISILSILSMLTITPCSYAGVSYSNGTKTVTTSGTALALQSTSQNANTLIICGDSGNTGNIAVGPSPVALASSQQGIILSPGSCVPIYTSSRSSIDISTIKVDSSVDGEKASYFWLLEN